jgi:hypothetical protein
LLATLLSPIFCELQVQYGLVDGFEASLLLSTLRGGAEMRYGLLRQNGKIPLSLALSAAAFHRTVWGADGCSAQLVCRSFGAQIG